MYRMYILTTNSTYTNKSHTGMHIYERFTAHYMSSNKDFCAEHTRYFVRFGDAFTLHIHLLIESCGLDRQTSGIMSAIIRSKQLSSRAAQHDHKI